jgi:2',3'-cyclic-nucleotide 2'-phosphodiesterase (5'-nucleotidase family)
MMAEILKIERSILPPGMMRLVRATPNPNGCEDTELFLLVGDAIQEPVKIVVPEPGLEPPQPTASLAEGPFRLKIFHFNDLHGHVTRFTPHRSAPIFSRIAWRLHQLRRAYRDHPRRAVLAMSAGDDSVGAVYDQLLAENPSRYQAHAAYRLYTAAGIDVCALGNHDLDLGVPCLAQALRRDADFPLLSANVDGALHLAGLHFPAAIFVVKGLRVGIIGLTTPARTAQHQKSGMKFGDPIRTMNNLLPALRPLCDVVIILSHLGYRLDATSATVSEAGDVELADSLSYGAVHLIVGGHTHHVLNEQGLSAHNIVNGIPIVQAGSLGRFVGEVDITVQQAAAVTNVRLTSTSDLPIDRSFERTAVRPLVEMVRDVFQRRIGVVDELPNLSTDAVRNAFAAGESPLSNFIADALVDRCRKAGYAVDFAAVDASSIRCGLEPGVLAFGDWFNIMPFADTIRLCRIDGRRLAALLQDNACRIDRPAEPHTERGFLQFSRRLRYGIDLGRERREATAVDITVDGVTLEALYDREFVVACTSFTRGPASDWERQSAAMQLPVVDIRAIAKEDTGLFMRDEVIAHIVEVGGLTEKTGAVVDGRLRIACPVAKHKVVK